MLKNICRLEWKSENGKEFHFTCDNDSVISDVKEAIFQFQKFIGQIEDQQKAALEKAEKEKKEKEEAKVEPVSEAQNVQS